MVTAPPGPASRALAARLAAVESPAVSARRATRAAQNGAEHAPIVYARGAGANVWDVDGNRYVDLAAGFGALVLGHAPADVLRASRAAEDALPLALGDVYGAESKVELCERLAALYPEPGARVMLGLSGADAVTCALKTAVLATGESGIVAFTGAYHGLSHGPLAACGLAPAFREPFAGQLGGPVTFVPYPATEGELDACMMQVRAAVAHGDVGAILVEPVLGRGGVVVPAPGLLPALREACDETGALLVADEIWTGLGRSGALLASTEAGVVPDVVCFGKALGAGAPISACVGSARAMAAWGAHGGATIHTATHFGAPPACAAALAALDAIARRGLAARSRAVGAAWAEQLRAQTKKRGVSAVRERGLMVGVALEGGGARALAVARALLAEGYIVLTGGAMGDVLTLTPPLDVPEALLAGFAERLGEVLKAVR